MFFTCKKCEFRWVPSTQHAVQLSDMCSCHFNLADEILQVVHGEASLKTPNVSPRWILSGFSATTHCSSNMFTEMLSVGVVEHLGTKAFCLQQQASTLNWDLSSLQL